MYSSLMERSTADKIKEFFVGLSAMMFTGFTVKGTLGKSDNPLTNAASAVLESKADDIATRSFRAGKLELTEKDPMQMLLEKKAEMKHASRLQSEEKSSTQSVQR